MKVKIFTKKTCPKCPAAKELASELKKKGKETSLYDLDTPDGLAEAAMFNIMSTPTIIVVDSDNQEAKSWRGSVPRLEEVIEVT